MGIARIIMYQTLVPRRLPAADQLEREWELFQRVEAGSGDWRFHIWETARPVVVLGRSSVVAEHVIEDACQADNVPVLRRCSGGGAVVLGPGSVNYAIALPVVSRPELQDVAASFRIILEWVASALDVPGLSIEGGTDLVLNGRKVSGNAQRRGRRALLHHGTLLYDFDPALALRYLKEPRRQPAYRARRAHHEFLGNVPLSRGEVRARVGRACDAFAGTGGRDVRWRRHGANRTRRDGDHEDSADQPESRKPDRRSSVSPCEPFSVPPPSPRPPCPTS
jgi:lipoate-protein ligase A